MNIWVFSDAKTGHENQSRGLVQALSALVSVSAHWLPAPPRSQLLKDFFRQQFSAGVDLADPHLLIGAGHATHLPLLLARRLRGGKAVVLMKPTLPKHWFDLCVIPAHDGAHGKNVFITHGALNPINPAAEKDPRLGIILLGGPSTHHAWRDQEILRQVEIILEADTKTQWTITSSRRTPTATLEGIQKMPAARDHFVPFERTSPGWLPAQLARATRVWASEDSVSMVYESLTAGAATGILAVPRRHDSRVSRGVDRLVQDGLAITFSAWRKGAMLTAPATRFNEAARVANRIQALWFPNA